MLFPTLDFAIFFFIVYSGAWGLRAYPQGRKLFLLAASYVFYGYWDARFVFLLGGSSLLSFFGGLALQAHAASPRRQTVLLGLIAAHLGLLGYFKYMGFFLETLSDLLQGLGLERELPVWEILLPVGISFFTFQGISYLIDVWRGRIAAETSVLDFTVYMAFFPHLVAGPIVRGAEFLPQLKGVVDPDSPLAPRTGYALLLILTGLFKKVVIASHVAVELVDPVFSEPDHYGGLDMLLAIYGYAVQIYCDFSAYSDMAIGIAALLGFYFPRNFNQPYRAARLRDFWRRWHMTLSAWLRDYLYIPLGGNRGSPARTARNLLLTMGLGGIWHGAAWTFVVWGVLHGVALGLERRFLPQDAPAHGWRRWLAILGVFHFVCFAWIFFRAGNLEKVTAVMAGLTRWATPLEVATPSVALLIALGLGSQFLPATTLDRLEILFNDLSPLERGALVGLGVVVINALGVSGVAPFIYFQF